MRSANKVQDHDNLLLSATDDDLSANSGVASGLFDGGGFTSSQVRNSDTVTQPTMPRIAHHIFVRRAVTTKAKTGNPLGAKNVNG